MDSENAKKKSPVKLSDVAAAAKVSPSTVSLALRNHPSITEETRRRVFEAQQRLGYRSLRKYGKPRGSALQEDPKPVTLMYCCVGRAVDSVGYVPFLDGTLAFCQEAGISLEVTYLPDHADFPSPPAHAYEKIQGVILTGNVTPKAIEYFQSFGLKVLVLGNFRIEGIPSIEIDVFWTGGVIAKAVRDEGFRNVVFLRRSRDNYYERQFLMGIRDEFETYGGADFSILFGGDTHEEASQAAQEILAKSPRVDAVICDSIQIAEIYLTELRVHRSPRQRLPAIYTTASSVAQRISPGIHVYHPALEACGREAARRLYAYLQGRETLECSFVFRNSQWRIPNETP